MGAQYVLADMKFDAEKWAELVSRAVEKIGLAEFAALMGMSQQGVRHWARNRYAMGFSYPSMTNFILACNLLDADPRQFFIMEE